MESSATEGNGESTKKRRLEDANPDDMESAAVRYKALHTLAEGIAKTCAQKSRLLEDLARVSRGEQEEYSNLQKMHAEMGQMVSPLHMDWQSCLCQIELGAIASLRP
jgi:hypothetical protein